MKDSVTILGSRGSVPVNGSEFARYGGANTCILVCLGGEYLVLDAGTGLMKLPAPALERPVLPLVLSHPHLDHLLGLPMCAYLLRPGARLELYSKSRGGLDAEAQVRRMLSPPLWPIGPEAFPAELRFLPLPERMETGGLAVESIEGVHPGGVSVLRVSAGGKHVVFATDCTLTPELLPRITEFARDCDLLLCDGQYSEEQFPPRSGYGHSAWTMAARLGRDCGAERTRIVHHDPGHTDAVLAAAEAALEAEFPDCRFAREGECIEL